MRRLNHHVVSDFAAPMPTKSGAPERMPSGTGGAGGGVPEAHYISLPRARSMRCWKESGVRRNMYPAEPRRRAPIDVLIGGRPGRAPIWGYPRSLLTPRSDPPVGARWSTVAVRGRANGLSAEAHNGRVRSGATRLEGDEGIEGGEVLGDPTDQLGLGHVRARTGARHVVDVECTAATRRSAEGR